jgi:hypothetical protein
MGGCGEVGHEADCICDVVIDRESPIRVRSVKDMWCGEAIATRLALSTPMSEEDIWAWLMALRDAHDIYMRRKTAIDDGLSFVKSSARNTSRPHLTPEQRAWVEEQCLLGAMGPTEITRKFELRFDRPLQRSSVRRVRIRLGLLAPQRSARDLYDERTALA